MANDSAGAGEEEPAEEPAEAPGCRGQVPCRSESDEVWPVRPCPRPPPVVLCLLPFSLPHLQQAA
eukprot:3236201-Rhodomonas_salina.3